VLKIKREINGKDVEIQLTEEEINEVRRQDKIEWAKCILANYAEMIINYDSIITDEIKMVEFSDLLEEKNLADNSDRELEIIEALFKTYEFN
jgi:hypothetical protein